MSSPIWLTTPGTLSNIPESIYYELQLDAYNQAGGSMVYRIIAGSLPSGLTLSSSGLISGIPSAVTEITTYTFTVRVTNNQNKIADRTFSILVGGLIAPIIVPDSGSLGNFIDGEFVDLQITAIEPTGSLISVFSLVSGTLPPGLTLTRSGRLYGYISPTTDIAGGVLAGFDSALFDQYPFNTDRSTNISRNYQFSVKVDDGAKIDINNFTMFVYARTNLTADNYISPTDPSRSANSNIISADSIILTADIDKVYSPILLTEEGIVANVRQNTLFQFKFDALDFDNTDLTFHANANLLPTGLTLNSTSGWVTGVVPYGPLGSVSYPFSVNVTKQAFGTIYTSETKNYSIKILGQIDDTVNWITPSSLGSIYNGDISDFQILASTPSNRTLNYRLVASSVGGLPIGLTLLTDGIISGRVSFQLDSAEQTYSFTVAAYDIDNLVYDEKTFTINVVKRDQAPYENLYIQALPNRAQRTYFDSIISNTDIFPPTSIYRFSDPWFGKNSLRRSLFMTGLNPLDVAEYAAAMARNHYWKTLNFGEIKTAQALDENFNVKYEVVYVELLDRGVNAQGLGPNISVGLPTNNVGVSTIYPNSFPNMIERIGNGVGYENRSILPKWMTSRQPNGTVLGFTRALVLCYANPGKSAEIAYRVKQVEDQFKLIDFTIDRYEWDSVLSDNWVKTAANGSGNITANTISGNVTGTGTTFATELQPNATIFVSNVELGNVANITSSNLLTLTANASSNVTANSFTYNHTFIVSNYTTGPGTIYVTSNSNVVTGSNATVIGLGNITGTAGNTVILGDSNTAFSSNLRIGKTIYVANTAIGIIAGISSPSRLRLEDPLTTSITNSQYTVTGNITSFTEDIHLGDTIVANGVAIGTVKSITNDFELVLTSNANVTLSNVGYTYTTRDPYTTPGQGDKYLKFPNIRVITSEFTTPEY